MSREKILKSIRSSEFVRFSLSGTAGFAVDYLTVLGLVKGLEASPYLARILSFLAAVSTTYLLNRFFTFRIRVTQGATTPGFLPYTLFMLAGLGTNYLFYVLAVQFFYSLPLEVTLLLAVSIGSVSGLVVNFIICRSILFRK